MRHQDNQRDLTHIGAFTGHVGAGDDLHSVLIRVHVRVVWHKGSIGKRLLHDRVTALRNFKRTRRIKLRAHIVKFPCCAGQGKERVQRFIAERGALKLIDMTADFTAYLLKNRQLKLLRLFLSACYFCFQIAQLVGCKSFRVCQRLLALIAHGDQREIRFCYFNIISENTVVLDF